ncbi:hypothetical protein [Actinacidiphila yeochonensis]|uniref:hypothetical protein n=1 Tax=Actinacidiphila yeochonensis TaxID=89050 RepID=UPI00055A5251|nr:hypothetical protein [Actinacidiphila yeochonensis]
MTPARRYGLPLTAVLGLVLLSGCGIRTTSVPVDAGPAPTRVSCAAPRPPAKPDPSEVTRQVFLVCSMQVTPVSRNLTLPDSRVDWYGRVQQLISQIQFSPRPEEAKAGFSSAVPASLELAGPREGDPASSLRLNQAPSALPPFALAQIVCTLTSDAMVAPDRAVAIGGPGPSDGLRSYTCTSDLRTGADDAGTPL